MSATVEHRLLAACMVGGPATVADCANRGVETACFTDIWAAQVWTGLLEAAAKDRKTTPFFVARRAFGVPLTADQTASVSALTQIEPTSAFANDLSDQLVGNLKRRLVSASLAKAVSFAKEAGNWSSQWEGIGSAISEALKAASSGRTVDLSALVDAAIADETAEKAAPKVGTGVGKLDDEIGKVAAGEVVVVAGRPGAGKTAFALQVADMVIRNGGSAMVVSLEMTAVSLLQRLGRQRAGRAGAIVRGCGADAYKAAKAARVDALNKLREADGRLHVFEVTDCGTLAKIEGRARLLVSRAQPIDLLVIDYLQLLGSEDSRANREQQVAQLSRRIKLLALELKIPILLLSQLNRASEVNERAPRISDLRESGAIEQDADRVWLLYPSPAAVSTPDAPSALVRIEQPKNRNGAANQAMDLVFDKASFSFRGQ